MTSRSSYSDRKEGSGASYLSLVRENLKRRVWSAALSTLLFFFLFPVPMMADVTNRLDERNFTGLANADLLRERAMQRVHEDLLSWSGINSGVLSFLLCILAVVIGVSAFSWLHNRRKTDFYHSLPVSRTRLFHVVNLNSILIVGVPYLVMSIAAALIVQLNTGITDCIPAVLTGYAGHMAFFLLAYMTVVLAMMLTGSVFVGILGCGVFFIYGPALFTSIHGMMGIYFRTYYQSLDHIMVLLQRTSPFTWMLDLTADLQSPGAIDKLPGSGLSRMYAMLQTSASFRAWTALAAAFILMLICLFLYHRRRSEAAGHAMAFAVTEAPIKLMISVPFAFTSAMLFQQGLEKDGWAIFGLVSAGLICCIVMEIIYRFDFRQALAHKLHLVLCLVLAALVFAFFRYDFIGYDRYLPSRVSVSSVGIVTPALDDPWQFNRGYGLVVNNDGTFSARQDTDTDPALTVMNRMTYHDLDNAYAIAEGCIAQQDAARDSGYEGYYNDISVCWHLADGRTCLRRYTADLNGLRDALDRLHDDPEYKTGFYPVLKLTPEDLAGVNYQDLSGYEHVYFSETAAADGIDAAALLKAYQSEFATLTAETRRNEMPIAGLQFKSHEFQQIADKIRAEEGYYGWMNEVDYYPVYPSFVKTLGILEQNGVRLNDVLAPERVESIVISDNRSFPGLNWEETEAARKEPLKITDPDQIREVLDASVITTINCDNRMGPAYFGLTVSVRNKLEAAGDESTGEIREDESAAEDADNAENAAVSDVAIDPAAGAAIPELAAAAGAGAYTYPTAESRYWYDNEGSIDYYAYDLVFDSRRIPDFVIEHFGIDEGDILLNTTRSY